MKIEKYFFGTTADKQQIDGYTLSNDSGMKVSVISYGGNLVSCEVPDKNGDPVDVLLGFDDISGYEKQDKYIGALIGRHANRIADGQFSLYGKVYSLYCNDGKNHLHGGKIGFDKKIWDVKIKDDALVLEYLSKDMEEGYPGNLRITVEYRLEENNTLAISYSAVSDRDTVCNLTNHAYFNLAGHGSGSIAGQKMQIFADYFTKANEESLPNGEITPVDNTPMDLRQPVPIGSNIDADFDQLVFAGGFDHNWVINNYDKTLRPAAVTASVETGIVMKTFTTLPGVQFYSGNYLDGAPVGKQGAVYNKRSGFCLETQYFPNALANPNFEQPVITAGEMYSSKTCYQFSVGKL